MFEGGSRDLPPSPRRDPPLTYLEVASQALRFHEAGKLFVPSVGPGYKDTGIRPWNYMNTKEREGGEYYERM